jgi:hypothetical protein
MILERLKVEWKGFLGYHWGTLQLWTGTWAKERRSRVFNRLSYKELTKTNSLIIFRKGSKTRKLELVTS